MDEQTGQDQPEPREEDLAPKPAVPETEEDTQVPGDEPVAEEDFTDAADAAENPEMDDAEADGAALDEQNQPQPVAPPPSPPVSGVAPAEPVPAAPRDEEHQA